MRPATLPCLLACLLFAAHAIAQPAAQASLQQQVDQIAAEHHGQVAVYARDLKTGQTVALSGGMTFN